VLVSFAAHVLEDVGLRPTAFSDPPTQGGDPSPLLRTITPHVTDGDAPRRRRLTTREAMAHPVELPLEASVQHCNARECRRGIAQLAADELGLVALLREREERLRVGAAARRGFTG
jgi:hypothetical protein